MTEEQYYAKSEEIKQDAIRIIDERIKKALSSGAIDLSKWEDNYCLPKIVMSAIGREIETQFSPFQKSYVKEVNSIYKFL